jgi:nitrite reductase/ring-hydroxylating ferredoxin subunit
VEGDVNDAPGCGDGAIPRGICTRPAGDAASLLPSTSRALCRVEEIPDGGAKGFPPAPGGFVGLFAVRRGDEVRVYVNSCPHIGVPLDWVPDRFLSQDGGRIVCAMHGAEFRIADGICIAGPCLGDRLEAVMIAIEDGVLLVPEDAGT